MSHPLPPLPDHIPINVAQLERCVTQQPSILDATAGLDPLRLDPPAASRKSRPCPCSVRLWSDANQLVESNWQTVSNILGESSVLELPNQLQWLPKVVSEATACQWLDAYAMRHAISLITALHQRVQSDTLTTPIDQPLRDALRDLGAVWEEHERMRHPRTIRTANIALIGNAVASDRHFQQIWLQPPPHHGQHNDQDNHIDDTRLIVQTMMDNLINPISDIEVCYFSRTDPQPGQRGLPLAVIELKSPQKLTPDKLHDVIHKFGRYCSSPALLRRWQDQADVRLRAAYHLARHDATVLRSEAREVLDCLVQLYHNMVMRRLTYGLLTSVTTTLLVRIDWHHPTQPGQVVHVATHDSFSQHIMPPPPATHQAGQHHLVRIVVALLIEQLRCGLVAQHHVDAIVQRMIDQLDGYPSDMDSSNTDHTHASHDIGSSSASDGNSDDSDGSSDADFTDDQGQRIQHAQHAQRAQCNDGGKAATAVATHCDPIYTRLIASLKRADARAELEKLIEAIEDRRNVVLYAPHQLGPLLCALFPLRSRKRKRTPVDGDGDGDDQRTSTPPAPSAPRQWTLHGELNHYPYHFSDLDLVLPRTLDSGPVPHSVNRRLAVTDDVELAREMASEQAAKAKLHIDTPRESMERDEDDRWGVHLQPPALDSDMSVESEGSSVHTPGTDTHPTGVLDQSDHLASRPSAKHLSSVEAMHACTTLS